MKCSGGQIGLSRHPFKVEIAGSSPVQNTIWVVISAVDLLTVNQAVVGSIPIHLSNFVRWSSLEWMSACHAEDHGFESHTDGFQIVKDSITLSKIQFRIVDRLIDSVDCKYAPLNLVYSNSTYPTTFLRSLNGISYRLLSGRQQVRVLPEELNYCSISYKQIIWLISGKSGF